MTATLNFSAEEARRQVNRQVVTELGTGLIARDPELVIAGKQITWRVPLVVFAPRNQEPAISIQTAGEPGETTRNPRLSKKPAGPYP